MDAEVEVTFSRRAYKGKKAKDSILFRLVAIYNHEANRYHVYITNKWGIHLAPKKIGDKGILWHIINE